MRKTKQEYVWVVEVLEVDRWEPCADAWLSREGARGNLPWWQERCPSDKFRVVKYVRAAEPILRCYK